MWGSKNFHLTDNWDRMSDINLPIRDTLKNSICGPSTWWMYLKFGVTFIRRNFYLKLKKKSCAQLKERESWFNDKKIDSEKQREPSLIKNLTQVKLASS